MGKRAINTGWGKSRFIVVLMGNDTIIDTRINSVSHAHNCKPTLATPCIRIETGCEGQKPQENSALNKTGAYFSPMKTSHAVR